MESEDIKNKRMQKFLNKQKQGFGNLIPRGSITFEQENNNQSSDLNPQNINKSITTTYNTSIGNYTVREQNFSKINNEKNTSDNNSNNINGNLIYTNNVSTKKDYKRIYEKNKINELWRSIFYSFKTITLFILSFLFAINCKYISLLYIINFI